MITLAGGVKISIARMKLMVATMKLMVAEMKLRQNWTAFHQKRLQSFNMLGMEARETQLRGAWEGKER